MLTRRQRPVIDLTAKLEDVIDDLCQRLPDFAHITPRRILTCVTRARGNSNGGVFAKIIPMRFPDGAPLKQVHDHSYSLPQIPTPHGDILYLIYVYTPRFFAQPFERRLLTMIHELYHIAPEFDGTLRRIGKRAHGASRAQFNDNLQPLVDRYLAGAPSAETLAVLRDNINDLARHATLTARTLAVPKAVKIR